MHFLLKLEIFVVATCMFPDRVLSQMQSGKYKYAHITSIESCEDSPENDVWPLSFLFTKNENDEYVLYFNVTLLKDVGENMGIDLSAQRWLTGSGWKTYYPFEDTDICVKACDQFPEFVGPVFKAMGLTVDEENLVNTCPVPAGEYISKPIGVKYSFSKFPDLPYGQSRVVVKFMDGDERAICLIVVGEVVPEGNGNPFG